MKKSSCYYLTVPSPSIIILFLITFSVASCSRLPNIKMEKGEVSLPVFAFLERNNMRCTTDYIFTYENRQIGYTGFIDQDIFITATHLGSIAKQMRTQQVKEFDKGDPEIFPLGNFRAPSRYINLSEYPFKVDDIEYYIRGKVIRTIESKNIKEIIFYGDFINFSFDERRQDFGFLFVKDTVSVSLLEVDNELYIIHAQSDKFKTTSFSELMYSK